MRIFGFRPLGLFGSPRPGVSSSAVAASRSEAEAVGYEAADAAAVQRRMGATGRDRRTSRRPDIEKILRSGA